MKQAAKIKIESGIEIPGGAPGTRYPFKEMKIGDSFLVPKNIKHTSFASAAHNFGKRNGMRFVTRTTPAGLRCWRTA